MDDQSLNIPKSDRIEQSLLYGALRYLGGSVAPDEVLDATLQDLWSVWEHGHTVQADQ
jgi:hypothetical protein